MECTPKADYMKFDQANGMAYAKGPQDLKVVTVHKCYLKQMHNG